MSKPRYQPPEQSRPDSLQSGGTRATETPNSNAQTQATNATDSDAQGDQPASV